MLEGGSRDAASQPPLPLGLYMHGGVGTGKTMLMDLLVGSAPPEFKVGCYGSARVFCSSDLTWLPKETETILPGCHVVVTACASPSHKCFCCDDELQIQSNCCSIRTTVEETLHI